MILEDGAESTDSAGVCVLRFDAGVLGKIERTPQGGMRVPATITRTGVFIYYDADGAEIREYRPPEEVFHADALASLADAPVTDKHPPVLVDSKNYKTYSAGNVQHSSVKQDGDTVAARLVIQDDALLKAIERRDRTQVSCGYTCVADVTPGVTPSGERYDRVQRFIRYNHVAIVKDGRAGKEVSLRLDAAGNQTTTERVKKMLRIDGVDYPLDTDAEREAAGLAMARYQTKVDAREGRADALEAKLKELELRCATAEDPKRIDSAVTARLSLVSDARKVLGEEAKFDGLSEREIMVSAAKKTMPEAVFEGRSDDYVRGLFEGAVQTAALRKAADPSGLSALREGTRPIPTEQKADAKDDSNAARERMMQSNREASRAPLAVSKDGKGN